MSSPNDENCANRRAVLRGALAIGATGLTGFTLGGCGGDGDEADAAAAKHVAPSGTALGPTKDIPVGGGKVFPTALVVVTQPKKGKFHAFSAICTHEGCAVNEVADGLIACPCHRSMYSITDGSVKAGPAPAPLPAVRITTTGGNITVA